MTFDWTNLGEDEQNVDESPGLDDPLYREDHPYDFKWCFHNGTGEPLIWRVNSGGDGKPVHRQMYEGQGWKKGDLAMGQAWYRPPQRKLDGTVAEPGSMRVLYYPHTTTLAPEPIIQKLLEHFPNAHVQSEEYSPGGWWGRGGMTTSQALSNSTDRMIDLAQEYQPNEQWRPEPFKVPDAAMQMALYKHQCPMCRGYLEDRGGIFTCAKCPFEYNENEQAQVGMI